MTDSKEPPPPSYAESQNYPQIGTIPSSQPPSSIFTYTSTPSAPPNVPTGVEHAAPPPYPPAMQATQYSYPPMPQQGEPGVGYSSYAQTYGPSPAAPIQAGYPTATPYGNMPGATASGVVYNPSQGTAQTYTVQNVPAGFTTTPLAYGTTSNINTRQRQKKVFIMVCMFILVMVIGIVIFFSIFL